MKKKAEKAYAALEVSDVKVHPSKKGGKTKAYARAVLNGQLQLTGLRIVERIVDGVNGYFVSYPLDPTYEGEEYHSVYYPLNKELREHIELKILEKYQEVCL